MVRNLTLPERWSLSTSPWDLVTGDDINLVDLDLARQDDRRSFGGQPFAQLRRHLLNVVFIQAQLFCRSDTIFNATGTLTLSLDSAATSILAAEIAREPYRAASKRRRVSPRSCPFLFNRLC